MYKIARLVLSEKSVYKDNKNNILRKCIILSSKEPLLYIKCKKKFSPIDLYIKIKFENGNAKDWTEIGKVGNEPDDIKVFYHLFTANWISNTKFNKMFVDYLNDNSHFDNFLNREIYEKKVITIDPKGATDLDDGFTFYDDTEFYYLDIHIADPVSYFIPNSEFTNFVFLEILKRISTCYIEDSCHLFPVSFVNIVSFLKSESSINKRSMSFLFKINKQSKDVHMIIKLLTLTNISNQSYDEFQNVCDNDPSYNSQLYNLSLVLIDIMKLNYDVNSLNIDFSHKIVEIFMLFTNWSIGNYLHKNSDTFIIRTQNAFCDKSDLDNVPSYAKNFLNFSANYLFVNNTENNNLEHFSLGLSNYTHVTSPMRRIVDFINHMIIYSCLDNSIKIVPCETINNINLDNINEIIKKQKKISSSYQILKHIKLNNNIFNACILDHNIFNDITFVLIVIYDEMHDFKKIINVELPINHNININKFYQFKVQLFYNSINYRSSKFPFFIKIL